jgi:hypothetical protein
MGDSAHTTHRTNSGKKSAPPLFLEDESFFQKSATSVVILLQFRAYNRRGRFLKKVIFEKKGGR